jgi:phage/plasmid-like protein (TIGR03299 family)
MAHEFNSGLFVGEQAWHGLGTVVETAPTMADAIKMAGMDWTVLERPMVEIDEAGNMELVEGYKRLKRSDTGKQLHVCKDSWTVVQNENAFSFFDPFIQDGDAKLSAAVSLRGGRRIAVTALLSNSTKEVVKGDPIEPYLVLANSHDGSIAWSLMYSNVRVVCQNTLGSALSEQKRRGTFAKFGRNGNSDEIAVTDKMVRLRHTSNIHTNIQITQNAVNVCRRQFDIAIDGYKAMAGQSMTTELFKAYLTNVFAEELTNEQGQRPIEKYTHYDQLMKNFEAGVGMDIPGVRGTTWAGFQAITEFVSHQRGGTEIEDARDRLNQMWFGSGAKLIEKAQNEALALV